MVYLNLDEISPIIPYHPKKRNPTYVHYKFHIDVYIVCLISVGHTNSIYPHYILIII